MTASIGPAAHKDMVALAASIFEKLITKYENDQNRFVDDVETSTGLIYRCAGACSLLLLLNAFPELPSDGRSENVILQEFDAVIQHVTTKGYDATPFVSEKMTLSLFSPKASPRYHYMDSVSWVLSFGLQLRFAHRTGRMRLAPEHLRPLHDIIQKSLDIVADAMCPQGGWNFSSACNAPNLYYSYAVSEALADFGDYALGETEELAKADGELTTYLGDSLLAKVSECRKQTAKWLTEKFVPLLGKQEINPLSKTPDKLHKLLYFTYFVIDMLIANSADQYGDWKQVQQAIEHGIYLSRIDFDRARADKEWWIDPIESSLLLEWTDFDKVALLPGRRKELYEPGLVPLALRCNALYAYYIAHGEDQKLADLFDLVYNTRREADGLWDSSGYSLIVTERAIEAIVDYNDYLCSFKKDVAAVSTPASELEEKLRDFVRKEVSVITRSVPPVVDSGSLQSAHLAPYVAETRALKGLRSAFAASNQHMKGGETSPDFEKEFSRFSKEVNDLIINILAQRIKDESGKDVKPEEVIGNYRKVLIACGLWLDKAPGYTMADVLEWAFKAYLRDTKAVAQGVGK